MLQQLQALPWLTIAFGGIVILFAQARYQRASKCFLPPSPQGDPIIGHLRRIPLEHAWVTFDKWRRILGESPLIFAFRRYELSNDGTGDIYHLRVIGTLIFVVSSPTIAQDLLDTKGANTSNRPYSHTMNNL